MAGRLAVSRGTLLSTLSAGTDYGKKAFFPEFRFQLPKRPQGGDRLWHAGRPSGLFLKETLAFNGLPAFHDPKRRIIADSPAYLPPGSTPPRRLRTTTFPSTSALQRARPSGLQAGLRTSPRCSLKFSRPFKYEDFRPKIAHSLEGQAPR